MTNAANAEITTVATKPIRAAKGTKTVKSFRSGSKVSHTIEELDVMTARYTTCRTWAKLIERNAKTGYAPKFTADGNKKREFARACKAVGIVCKWDFAAA